MKETRKWIAALLAGAAAVSAAAAGLAFWSRKKHKALKLGKPESQPPGRTDWEISRRRGAWGSGAQARGGSQNQRSRGGQP